MCDTAGAVKNMLSNYRRYLTVLELKKDVSCCSGNKALQRVACRTYDDEIGSAFSVVSAINLLDVF